MKEIETLSSKVVYKNKWMSVREDDILRPSGNKGVYGVVDKPDFCVVIPIQNGHIYCVEQYRYPVKARCIEFPQGSWESRPEEKPEIVAAGELREETGLLASNMMYVGHQFLATGYSSQGYHIYMATGLTQSSTQFDEEEEDLVTKKYSINEFEELLINGTIRDATTTNSFCFAKLKGLLPSS